LPRIKKKHHELKKVCWQKKESVHLCAISSPEQFSTSVLAEQLSAMEVGVKRLHVVYAANDNFYGGASPRSPVVATPLPHPGKVPFPIKSAKYSYVSQASTLVPSPTALLRKKVCRTQQKLDRAATLGVDT